jgi:type I restriction enzyme S subunit
MFENSEVFLEELLESQVGINFIEELIINQGVLGKLNKISGTSEVLSLNFPQKYFLGKIPDHWGELNFGDHLDIQGGGQPPKTTFIESAKEGYVRLYQIRDYGPYPIPVYVPKQLVTKTSSKGDILIARYGASGKIFWAEDGAYNVALAKFIYPTDLLIPEYAFFLLKSSLFKNLVTSTTRVAVDGFNKNDLKDIHFPLPPITEQKQIVSTISQILSIANEYKTARINVNNYSSNFRKASLEELATANTPEEIRIAWDRIQNHWSLLSESAESMPSIRLLIHDFAIRGMFGGDQSFHEVKLKEIAVINYGYTESANHAEVGPKFLRITDIQFGKVDWSTVPYCPISNADEEKYSLRDGDLVFARTGATTGKSFLLSDPPRSVCASYLIRVRPDSRKVLPEYLYLYFQSGRYWLDVKGGMSGTAQGGFNSTKLGALSVRIPDLQSQQIIVDKARELLQISEDLQLVLSQREEIAEKFALSIMATSA